MDTSTSTSTSTSNRVLTAATFVNALGNGLFLSAGTVYLLHTAGLPATVIGLGLTAATAVGLAASIPAGRLADRHHPRTIYAALLAAEGVAMLGYLTVRNLVAFIAVAALAAAAHTGARAARGALVAQIAGPQPARFRAVQRSVTNIGIAAGGAGAAAVIAADTDAANTIMIVTNAATFLAAAILCLRLPHRPPPPPATTDTPPTEAVVGKPYLAVTALNAVISMHFELLALIVPLWLLTATEVPRPLVAVTMVINTVLVATLQVQVSRGVDDPTSAAAAMRRAGITFAISSVGFAALPWLPVPAAVVLLMSAVAVHTFGELWHQAGSIELSFTLAPPGQHGRYQGVFGLGVGAAQTLAPALLSMLCLRGGAVGWVATAALLCLPGLLAPAAASWAQRTAHRGGVQAAAAAGEAT